MKKQTVQEATGVEPVTYRTAADCSTTELYLQFTSAAIRREVELIIIYT